jgi:hypothetical protein
MERPAKLLMLPLLTLLLCACSLYPPDYAGTWVDDESWYGWTYTLEFERSEFSIAMETYDTVLESTTRLVTSGVMSAGSGVMEATITGQEIDGAELGDSELQAFITYIGGGEYTAQYEISGGIIALSGDLVEKICSPLATVRAVKQ